MASRFQELIRVIPPCTLFYIGLCIVFFVFQFLFGGIDKCAISTYSVLYQFQFQRIFLSAFTHLGLLHIVFNMMSFYSINGTLERKYGSVFMFYLILLFTFINGLLYVLIYQLLSFVSKSFLYSSAAGFSGVIFSLLTTLSLVVQNENLSIFGLFSVPRKWYALTYLILMSVLMPGVSFVGHLCGVISGFLFASGYLNWFIPMHFIVRMESGFIGKWMKKSEAFVYIPEMHEIIGSALSFSSMLQLIGNGIKSLIYSLFIILKSILLFCFDSIFPPVLSTEEPLPASGQVSDIENRHDGKLTIEEIRKQRLEALSV